MKDRGLKLLPTGLFCLLLGCSQYQSKPLTEQAVQQQLETPTAQQLSIQAAQIKHPLLKPVAFNIQDGLSPDEAAILAVLRNPELRAARDRHGIANAQLLQAGLLPNPTFSYNFAALSGGLDQGKVTGLGLGLGWEVTSLITKSNKLTAAEAEQQAVDLHIAWQEWQIAQAAKSAAYQLLVYSKQQLLLEEMLQRLESNRVQIQQAAVEGLVTELDRVAAISAKNGVDVRLQAVMQQKNQQQQRLNRFNDQLSDMLNLMVNGLRAGYSTMQAMEAVSKELPSPISDEFRRVVQEMQIGIPLETALENLLRRIPSPDLDFVVTAINVQREVGGNLSEILDTISFTIRERVRIKGEVRTLTAQVRTSGTVLSFIPFGLTLVLWFLNPTYLMSFSDAGPLCTSIIACVVIGLVGSGYFVMMRIADIEV